MQLLDKYIYSRVQYYFNLILVAKSYEYCIFNVLLVLFYKFGEVVLINTKGKKGQGPKSGD